MSSMVPQIGDVIGDKYRIERKLGGGGMGTVFSATHLMTGRRFALKWMNSRVAADTAARERFIREFQAAGSIDHANVVAVLDVGSRDGALYIVMEYLEGESLGARIARGALAPSECVPIVVEAMRGVAAAHRMDIVHRDLKPDNIFICQNSGRHGLDVKVLDFGVAKGMNERATQMPTITARGMAVGTPPYMAPEQVLALPSMDHRVDIYAFGVILYEALSGQLPFAGVNGMLLLERIVRGGPPQLSQVVSGVPVGLEATVMRALSRDPRRRFGHLAEFAACLQPWAAGAGAFGDVVSVRLRESVPDGPRASRASNEPRASRASNEPRTSRASNEPPEPKGMFSVFKQLTRAARSSAPPIAAASNAARARPLTPSEQSAPSVGSGTRIESPRNAVPPEDVSPASGASHSTSRTPEPHESGEAAARVSGAFYAVRVDGLESPADGETSRDASLSSSDVTDVTGDEGPSEGWAPDVLEAFARHAVPEDEAALPVSGTSHTAPAQSHGDESGALDSSSAELAAGSAASQPPQPTAADDDARRTLEPQSSSTSVRGPARGPDVRSIETALRNALAREGRLPLRHGWNTPDPDAADSVGAATAADDTYLHDDAATRAAQSDESLAHYTHAIARGSSVDPVGLPRSVTSDSLLREQQTFAPGVPVSMKGAEGDAEPRSRRPRVASALTTLPLAAAPHLNLPPPIPDRAPRRRVATLRPQSIVPLMATFQRITPAVPAPPEPSVPRPGSAPLPARLSMHDLSPLAADSTNNIWSIPTETSMPVPRQPVMRSRGTFGWVLLAATLLCSGGVILWMEANDDAADDGSAETEAPADIFADPPPENTSVVPSPSTGRPEVEDSDRVPAVDVQSPGVAEAPETISALEAPAVAPAPAIEVKAESPPPAAARPIEAVQPPASRAAEMGRAAATPEKSDAANNRVAAPPTKPEARLSAEPASPRANEARVSTKPAAAAATKAADNVSGVAPTRDPTATIGQPPLAASEFVVLSAASPAVVDEIFVTTPAPLVPPAGEPARANVPNGTAANTAKAPGSTNGTAANTAKTPAPANATAPNAAARDVAPNASVAATRANSSSSTAVATSAALPNPNADVTAMRGDLANPSAAGVQTRTDNPNADVSAVRGEPANLSAAGAPMRADTASANAAAASASPASVPATSSMPADAPNANASVPTARADSASATEPVAGMGADNANVQGADSRADSASVTAPVAGMRADNANVAAASRAGAPNVSAAAAAMRLESAKVVAPNPRADSANTFGPPAPRQAETGNADGTNPHANSASAGAGAAPTRAESTNANANGATKREDANANGTTKRADAPNAATPAATQAKNASANAPGANQRSDSANAFGPPAPARAETGNANGTSPHANSATATAGATRTESANTNGSTKRADAPNAAAPAATRAENANAPDANKHSDSANTFVPPAPARAQNGNSDGTNTHAASANATAGAPRTENANAPSANKRSDSASATGTAAPTRAEGANTNANRTTKHTDAPNASVPAAARAENANANAPGANKRPDAPNATTAAAPRATSTNAPSPPAPRANGRTDVSPGVAAARTAAEPQKRRDSTPPAASPSNKAAPRAREETPAKARRDAPDPAAARKPAAPDKNDASRRAQPGKPERATDSKPPNAVKAPPAAKPTNSPKAANTAKNPATAKAPPAAKGANIAKAPAVAKTPNTAKQPNTTSKKPAAAKPPSVAKSQDPIPTLIALPMTGSTPAASPPPRAHDEAPAKPATDDQAGETRESKPPAAVSGESKNAPPRKTSGVSVKDF
jgi:serine/threonine protein kinase